MEKLQQLKEIVDRAKRIVFFGGAGVSTESGIPDFRGVDGIYHTKYKYPPEVILSSDFFFAHTSEFYDFYRSKMLYLNAAPNVTHLSLAALEQSGKLAAVVTQNIDGLHEKAGSRNVYNLHGSVDHNHCLKCHKWYSADYVAKSDGVPMCECGGVIKPDVVLYGEALPEDVVDGAIDAISACDCLIVGGTSLTVYPAASFVRYFNGSKLVLINKQPISFDASADLVLHCGLGEAFSVLDYVKSK